MGAQRILRGTASEAKFHHRHFLMQQVLTETESMKMSFIFSRSNKDRKEENRGNRDHQAAQNEVEQKVAVKRNRL